MQILSAEYEKILGDLSELLSDEKDLVANAAVLSALLFEALEAVDWVGIYFLRNGELVVGPFQGRVVKPRLSLGRSNAGRVVRDMRPLITEGRGIDESMSEAISQAQVLVPVMLHERCIGVLEMGSPFVGRFDDHDRAGLEAIARLLITASDTTPLIPRRNTISELRPPAPVPERREPPQSQQRPDDEPRVHYHEIPAPSDKSFVVPTLRITLMVAFAAMLPTLYAHSGGNNLGERFGHAALAILLFAAIGTTLGAFWRLHVTRVTAITAGISVAAAIVGICASLVGGISPNVAGYAIDSVCALIGGYFGGAIGRALRRRSSIHRKVSEVRRP